MNASPAVLCIVLSMLALPTHDALAAKGVLTPCYFDHGDDPDLAIAAPGDSQSSLPAAGYVHVLYSDNGDLSTAGNQLLDGDDTSFGASAGAQFGTAMACGDFNGDSFDDLAVSAPEAGVGGVVHIFPGSASGIDPSDTYSIEAIPHGPNDPPELHERFGAELAVGDFNGDGVDDLAVGVPGREVSGRRRAGAVHLAFGSDFFDRLLPPHQQHDRTSTAGEGPGTDNQLGFALAVGRFDGDLTDDLAIGAPYDRVVGVRRGGSVMVLTELDGAPFAQLFHRGFAGLEGNAEVDAHFGFALVAGNFDGAAFDDLAIGAPGSTAGFASRGGSVHLLYSRSSGRLSAFGNEILDQSVPSMTDWPNANDRFGTSLARGRFNTGAIDDLVVGIPGEEISGREGAGAIALVLGTSGGLASGYDQLWHQNRTGVPSSAEIGDGFGTTVAVGDVIDFFAIGRSDVIVGVPGEGWSNRRGAGIVQVIAGTTVGLTTAKIQTWSQVPLLGAVEENDGFGGTHESEGVYRVPFVNGTSVRISRSAANHAPPGPVDMVGQGPNNVIVAAETGVVRFIQESRSATGGDENNYVWISHPNGEWTKYSHMLENSVALFGVETNDTVVQGQAIGLQGSVGTNSPHLHFEVRVPDEPASVTPTSDFGAISGRVRAPRLCDVEGGTFVQGATITADDC